MRRFILTGLFGLLVPLAASASSGTWSGYSVGGTLSVGHQTLTSRPLVAALPATAELHHIAWRISLLSPPPPGLHIKLCSQQRCLSLPALAGQRDDPAPLTAQGPFYFVYSVESRGALLPPLNVVKNQLTLNYR